MLLGSLAPEALGPGRAAGVHFVSQGREKPNARSQKSFDNACWSGAQAACGSRTAARIMQARTQRGVGAADGDLGSAKRHFEFAQRARTRISRHARERHAAV